MCDIKPLGMMFEVTSPMVCRVEIAPRALPALVSAAEIHHCPLVDACSGGHRRYGALSLIRVEARPVIEKMGPTRRVAALGVHIVRYCHQTDHSPSIVRRQLLAAGACPRRRKIRPASATNAQTPSSNTNPQR